VFHGKRVLADLLGRVVAALVEGLGIRATARVFELEPSTVRAWLVEAADQLQAFSRYLLRDLQVTQVQLDELFAVLSEGKAEHVSGTEALAALGLGRSRPGQQTPLSPAGG
jgi:hypothetical protein